MDDTSGKDIPEPTDLNLERSFRFEVPTYDINNFYVHSTNGHNHSDWTKLRVPPWLHDQISFIVSKESPFYAHYRGSVSALMRDAVVHRLAHLVPQTNDESAQMAFNSLITDLNIANMVAAEQHGRWWVQKMCEEIDSIVEDYSKRRQYTVALEKLSFWLEKIPGRDEAHHAYVDQYIRSKQAELLKTLRGGVDGVDGVGGADGSGGDDDDPDSPDSSRS